MADTGKEVWRYRLANHDALGITMAPLIYDNYVIVSTESGGNSRATYEGGAAGIVYFLDLAISRMLWTFDTTKDQLWGNFLVRRRYWSSFSTMTTSRQTPSSWAWRS